jgi:hypothetical protein
MFSDKKLVNSVKERGMSGYDVKLSGQAPYLPWAKIKGTYYHCRNATTIAIPTTTAFATFARSDARLDKS